MIATAMPSAITSTTTITSSTPTALALIIATMRVEAIASTAWMSSTTTVIRRATFSLGSSPKRGISAVLAIALSTAAAAMTK